MGVPVKEAVAARHARRPSSQMFQQMLFSKIVPNCKKLGLLDASDGWLRDRFDELGVIQFEDWADTGEEYEAVRRAHQATAPPPRPPPPEPLPCLPGPLRTAAGRVGADGPRLRARPPGAARAPAAAASPRPTCRGRAPSAWTTVAVVHALEAFARRRPGAPRKQGVIERLDADAARAGPRASGCLAAELDAARAARRGRGRLSRASSTLNAVLAAPSAPTGSVRDGDRPSNDHTDPPTTPRSSPAWSTSTAGAPVVEPGRRARPLRGYGRASARAGPGARPATATGSPSRRSTRTTPCGSSCTRTCWPRSASSAPPRPEAGD